MLTGKKLILKREVTIVFKERIFFARMENIIFFLQRKEKILGELYSLFGETFEKKKKKELEDGGYWYAIK